MLELGIWMFPPPSIGGKWGNCSKKCAAAGFIFSPRPRPGGFGLKNPRKPQQKARFGHVQNMFKINEKKFDCGRRFCELVSAHGKEQQQNTTMKKTLLIAAAALAAGIMTSQAQVYSQNIVGYANIPMNSSGQQYLIATPFKIGVSNGANEIYGTSLPEFSSILIWDVPTQNYKTVQVFSGSATGWADAGFSDVPPPILPVGQGYFVNPAAPTTNVFAGAVAVNVGTSNKMVLSSSGIQYLIACVVPYAGAVTNGNNSTGGPNLNGLPEFSALLFWDVPTQNYKTVQTFSGSGTGWADAGFSDVPVPSISVGQGFFINLPSAYTWTTGL